MDSGSDCVQAMGARMTGPTSLRLFLRRKGAPEISSLNRQSMGFACRGLAAAMGVEAGP